MKSLPEIHGQYVSLRALLPSDAEFLFDLRSDRVLNRFLNDGPPSLDAQRTWMEGYFKRENDHNFVVVSRRDGQPKGTVAIIDIDAVKKRAEPGRWLVRGESRESIEADLLSNRYAFDTLGLETLYFSIFTGNAPVISYHTKCGANKTDRIAGYFKRKDGDHDAFIYELTRETFHAIKQPMLEKLLYRAPSSSAPTSR